MSYYADKLDRLKDLFGASTVELSETHLTVDGHAYAIEQDVIILTEGLDAVTERANKGDETIDSFSNEWESYPDIIPEHRQEYEAYFDIVPDALLKDATVLDLGCGIGRWSYHVHAHSENLVLADASRAIFVARKNMAHAKQAIFFRCDLRELPFRKDAFDFLFCLGVLHHLEEDCLTLTRGLAPYANRILIYLYYALDNRPWTYRAAFYPADLLRRALCRIKSEPARQTISKILSGLLYVPLIWLGRLLNIVGLGKFVPIYEGYKDSSFSRLAQDVYDRFFTPIEQRVSKAQIETLKDQFDQITISTNIPFWHFILTRDPAGKQ